MRSATVAALFVVFGMSAVAAQDAKPVSEVVSVKPRQAGERGGGMDSSPGRLTAENMTPIELVQYAHQIRAPQIIGAPRWTSDERFDVVVTLAAGVAGSAEVFRQAMKEVLAARFGLVAHREVREAAVALLVLARQDGTLGIGLKRATQECTVARDRSTCFKRHASGTMEVVGYEWRRIDLPLELQRYGASDGLLVVDRTDLTGRFDLSLTWTPTPEFRTGTDSGVAAAPEGVSLSTAIREQLGLELRRGRAQVEHLIVDALVRPQPN